MKLPYAEEIREARELAEEASEAVMKLQRARNELHAATLLEGHLAQGMKFEGDLPGTDVLHAAAAWRPELEALLDDEIGGGTALRLRVRRERLQTLIGMLEPLADEARDRAQALHDLQHAQHHELEKPEWMEVIGDLIEVGRKRDALAQALAHVTNARANLEPVRGAVLGAAPLLEQELIEAATADDPDGVVALRVASLAQQQLAGIARLMVHLKFVVPLPFEPAVPDTPHARHKQRLLGETGAVLSWLRDLSEQLVDRAALLDARQAQLDAAHTAAEDRLKEWMG